jgi:predicted aminopeptidase
LQSTQADPRVRAAWLGRRERREQVITLLAGASARLRSLYQSNSSADEKRAGKARIVANLRSEFAVLRARHPSLAGWARWFAQPLGNAHLMSVGLYHDLVPAFLALYRAQQQELPRFYEAARALGSLAPDERAARLAALARME